MVPKDRLATAVRAAPLGPAARTEPLRAEGLLPADLLLVAYLATTGVLAAGSLSQTGMLLAAAHLGAIALVLWIGRMPAPRRRALLFVRLLYPVLVTPALYTELATLNQLAVPGYFDVAVQGWEAAIFGSQLSMVASDWYGSLWFSEMLHFGYVSYYLLVPAAGVWAATASGPRGLERFAFSVALAFFICYACFAVFPVAGPRYEFVRIQGPLTEGPVFELVHRILESGSSKGTAFPSSHIAATLAAWLAAGRESRRAFVVLAPLATALTLGTVYGRFHYGIDAVVGIAVAVVAYRSTPWLMDRLRIRAGNPDPAPVYPSS
ncbi:MAG: phosphatase PAP2 family protein [Gemmatimonadota bacterium]